MPSLETARERRLAYGAWLVVCLSWGTIYLAIRLGVAVMPPLLFNGLRVVAAGALLAAWLRAAGVPFPQSKDLPPLMVVGVALLGVGNGMLALGARWLPSGLSALIIAMAPFWMIGFEALIPGGERITPRALFGLALGAGGLALLVLPRVRGGIDHPEALLGILCLQVSCASWAAGSIYSRRRPVPVKPLMGAALQMIAGGCATTLAGSLLGEWRGMHWSVQGALAFLWLMLFGSIIGYSAYVYALQKLPVQIVSLYAYVNPVIAVLLGWIVLREPLGWREVTAIAVILGGVAVVRTGPVSSVSEPARSRGRTSC